jgi:pyruvate kinase
MYFKPGDKVSLGDGETAFVVKEVIEQDKVLVEFVNDGEVDEYRGLMSPNLADCMDHCSVAVSSLALFRDIAPDYLALSFVNSADYVDNIRKEINALYHGEWEPKIYAKIESPEGIKNLAEIMDASDGVIIARGDLGLTIDYTEIILEQKRACKLGLEKKKPVVIATQILTSCIDNVIPHRCELADLTNMVLDGAGGILLSQETSLNEKPGRVIQIAREIINKVENYHLTPNPSPW